MNNFITEKLNDVQKMAVVSDSKYILVTAGAGSGKTRVLTERIINLINCKFIHPENILAITFTNKASNVMKERLVEKGLNAGRLWISTFHSICVRILRENAQFLEGYNNNFTIFDESDKNKVIADILKEEKIEEDGFKKKLAYHISNFKNKNQTIEKYIQDNFFERNIEDIALYMKKYEEKMKQNNAFDFDDLLQKTLMLLTKNKEVLLYYQNKFKHILVDEFQDTNEIQYDLIKLLSSGENSIFVVGDEDQCIYSWRGANYENISNFTKDFLNVEIIKLEQNYRSSKKIIAAANSIISKNLQRIDKKLWTDNDEGIKIEYKKCYDEGEEAEYIASTIYALNSYNGYNFKDMAVLVRLNSLTRNIEEKLLNYGINYRVYGGMKFYERLEIKNFLAYLKVVSNIKDDVSFSKIANWPKRSIGDASLDKLKHVNPALSMLENLINLENSGLTGTTFKKLFDLKLLFDELLIKKEELNLVDFTRFLVDRLMLKEKLNIEEEDKNRILNIEQLLLSIEEFAKNNENTSLNDYLQSVTLVSDIDSYNEEDDCVTIATVHASKGLEFKCVFVIGLEEGIFPLIRQDSDCDFEEERRLMYVAVTRSMERLYLSRTMSRFLYGFRKPQICSTYVKDLGFEQPKQRNEYTESSYGYSNSNSYSTFENNLYSSQNYVKSVTEVKLNTVSDKNFNVGDKITHTKYGEGVIVSINKDVGKIAFKGVGIKELMLNLAPITKI